MEAFLAALGPQRQCTYSLEVVQQPVRARMCGFGDKDRRPISPPLIVKLTARDSRTGEEVTVDDLDTTFLILAADLRNANDLQDANLIFPPSSSNGSHVSISSHSRTPTPPASQHSVSRSSSPSSPPIDTKSPFNSRQSSITPASTTSPPKTTAPLPFPVSSGLTGAASPEEEQKPVLSRPPTPKRRLSSPTVPPLSLAFPATSSSTPFPPSNPSKRLRTTSGASSTASSFPQPPPPPPVLSCATPLIPYARDRRSPIVGGLTSAPEHCETPPIPNLIGTLHTNAYKLKDLSDEKAAFFVLPDLSVRTEGEFRLRLRLLSIGLSGTQTNTGTAVVATKHTNDFKVFSAKKFEGMLDPTPLSQCFAKQGVRIPTRKVAKSRAAPASKAATMANAVR